MLPCVLPLHVAAAHVVRWCERVLVNLTASILIGVCSDSNGDNIQDKMPNDRYAAGHQCLFLFC